MPRARIKDEKTSQQLRARGESTKKRARIANASDRTSRRTVAAQGGRSPSYADWRKQDLLKRDLLKRARETGIKGRSSMSKKQLIDAQALTRSSPAGAPRPGAPA